MSDTYNQNHDLEWQNISTVLLDMDGTLLDLKFDNYFWSEYVPLAFAKKNKLSFSQSQKELTELINLHKGTLNWYCLDFWSELLQLPIAQLKNEVADKVALRNETIDFLQTLHQLDTKVFLVTNAHHDSLAIKLRQTKIMGYFDRCITSHEYGEPKETQAFWHSLQQDLGFAKEQSIFIDDSLSVLQSARQYGIQHIFAIKNPDSSRTMVEHEEFISLEHLTEILP